MSFLRTDPELDLPLEWTRTELQNHIRAVETGFSHGAGAGRRTRRTDWAATLLELLLVHVSQGLDVFSPLKAAFVPPYLPDKFPNKWRKMEADQPARTLMAHLGKDSYSHIHYDSTQARTISVREAARLQSFPDSIEFCGAMNAAFRQIGNAVPPLLAYSVACSVRQALRKPTTRDARLADRSEVSVSIDSLLPVDPASVVERADQGGCRADRR